MSHPSTYFKVYTTTQHFLPWLGEKILILVFYWFLDMSIAYSYNYQNPRSKCNVIQSHYDFYQIGWFQEPNVNSYSLCFLEISSD